MSFRLAISPWCYSSNLILLLIAVSGCSGCTSETSTANTTDQQQRRANFERIELPVVEKTPDQLREELQQYEPFSPEFEETRLRMLVALDEIRKREGVEGFVKQTPAQHKGNQSAMVDPETGRLAWRALTCFNPECTGRGKGGGPYLFVRTFSHLEAGANGEMIMREFDMSELQKPAPCPACGEFDFIRSYDPPETELRRRQLNEQLAAARGASSNGKRSVKEIMVEIANLPKLFLVPEE